MRSSTPTWPGCCAESGRFDKSEMLFESEFAMITCAECGIHFAVPAHYQNCRAEDHKTFWCPNGHQQSYRRETEADKYKRLYNDEAAKMVPLREKYEAEKRAHTRIKKKLKSVETRAAAGVCPCCNRTFKQLAEHMKSNHQGFMLTQGVTPPAPKQLTGEIDKSSET